MNDISQILEAIERGDLDAVDELVPLIYQELRNLAARQLANERPGQSFDSTALVHEVFLRFFGTDRVPHWEGRRHFFAAASEAMRHILVDHARRKKRLKHGGGRLRMDLNDDMVPIETPFEDVIAVDESLEALARVDAEAAELVKLRFFSGWSMDETAEILGISPREAYRKWAFTRAWLYHHIHPDESPSQDVERPSP